jgi:hypothetical protein
MKQVISALAVVLLVGVGFYGGSIVVSTPSALADPS